MACLLFVYLTFMLKRPVNISFLWKHHHTALIHGIGMLSLAHESPKWDFPWPQDASHLRFKHKKNILTRIRAYDTVY